MWSAQSRNLTSVTYIHLSLNIFPGICKLQAGNHGIISVTVAEGHQDMTEIFIYYFPEDRNSLGEKGNCGFHFKRMQKSYPKKHLRRAQATQKRPRCWTNTCHGACENVTQECE